MTIAAPAAGVIAGFVTLKVVAVSAGRLEGGSPAGNVSGSWGIGVEKGAPGCETDDTVVGRIAKGVGERVGTGVDAGIVISDGADEAQTNPTNRA